MYLKNDTLLLADAFQSLRKMCLKIYQLDPAKFYSTPRLAWQPAFKNTELRLELLTDIYMSLMFEKELEEEYVTQFIDMPKLIIHILKIVIKIKNAIYIKRLKQALNHGLVLTKAHRVIQFNKKDWLKPYIDVNTELTQKAKNNFEEDFFKLMNIAVLEKLWIVQKNIETLNLYKQKGEDII